MAELHKKFLALMELAIVEFSINHPGTKTASRLMEAAMDVTENQLSIAMESHKNLSDVVNEFICYEFTGGRKTAGFSKPSWLS